MTSPSDRPAFPSHGLPGMTLRDYFAAKAMTLMPDSWDWSQEKARERSARIAYDMADAMLKAREGKADQPEDPCPGCRPGVVCRTPSCGRLKARDGSR